MRARLYDPDITDVSRPQDTYWRASAAGGTRAAPLTVDCRADVCVIGAGYCGLSAAHRLASHHSLDVCVVDAGPDIGWGASGLNGGFVSAGGTMLDEAQMTARAGVDEARRYMTAQAGAVEQLRAIIRDDAIACDVTGDGNLYVAHSPRAAAAMADYAAGLPGASTAAEWIDAQHFRRNIHDGPETFGALRLRPAFGVHPVKLVHGLARRAQSAGVTIATGTQIVSWQRAPAAHVLRTADGHTIRASRVVVATNGYLANGLHPGLDNRALPVISSIIVTQPYTSSDLRTRGFLDETPIYNSRHLLFYYRRLPDGRILFGARGDLAGTPDAAAAQARITLAELRRVLPAFEDARIDFAWRGLVCLTARRTLAVGLAPGETDTAYAFGCHGSGVATMCWAGRQCADLVTGLTRMSDLPALVRGLPPRLPGSDAILRWGLSAAYRWYAIVDRR